jgi:cellulose synthase/poly-beta-1,6-N-acetylglucosamine synthase-like glycosyltransferase
VILAVLLFCALIVYVVIAGVIASGIHSRYPRLGTFPSVSIVIPARNEEKSLHSLLDSLLAIDYPSDLLEIIIVNDQSEDRTKQIAESYRGRFQCNYDVFDVVPETTSSLRAKTRPLAQGLDRARGEIILMPDADNRIPPDWAKCMTSYFTDNVGLVCGPIFPDPLRRTHLLLTWFETVDAAFLLGVCAGFSGLGRTQALIGSNFAVRRDAYEDIGTYRNLDFHFIEDLSLLGALQQTNRWKAVFPSDRGTLLWTLPQRTFGTFIRQRHRWLAGWGHVKPGIRAALAFGFAVHAMWPLWLLLPPAWFVSLYALLLVGDGMVAVTTLYRHKCARFVWLLPLYPVFAFTYALALLGLVLTRREVIWKERSFVQ